MFNHLLLLKEEERQVYSLMMFDADISVFQTSVGVTSPEAIEQGVPPHLELTILTGFALPIANPQTGEPLLVPAGKYNFALGRDQAIELFTKGLEAAESLPEGNASSGKIVVARSNQDVENAAKALHIPR